jgi:hypothetical protein
MPCGLLFVHLLPRDLWAGQARTLPYYRAGHWRSKSWWTKVLAASAQHATLSIHVRDCPDLWSRFLVLQPSSGILIHLAVECRECIGALHERLPLYYFPMWLGLTPLAQSKIDSGQLAELVAAGARLIVMAVCRPPAAAADSQSGVAMPFSGGDADLTDTDLLAIIYYLRTE